MRSTCGVCTLRRFPSSVSTSRRSRPDVTSRLTRSARCFDSESGRVAHTDPFRGSYSWKLRFSFPPPSPLRFTYYPRFVSSFPRSSNIYRLIVCLSTSKFIFDKRIWLFSPYGEWCFRIFLTKLDRFIPMEVKVRETRAYQRIGIYYMFSLENCAKKKWDPEIWQWNSSRILSYFGQ